MSDHRQSQRDLAEQAASQRLQQAIDKLSNTTSDERRQAIDQVADKYRSTCPTCGR